METEEKLQEETVKWADKIRALRKTVAPVKGKEYFLKNIDAYISDSGYFMDKNDMIRSFEAIIWAWAWLEIGLSEGLIRKNQK